MERFIKSANDSYAVTPKKPLVSQSANGKFSTYAAKKDTDKVADEVSDEYTKYFPEDKTQIPPGLDEVLDLDNKTESITALNKYKKENGIPYGGKKSKTKKSKTKKRKFRSTKNKKKNKRSHKKI
jgi:hypothetical protein